jgi:5,5'-dehydrodivanillate O-demethylase oxygenase subunit
VLTREANERLTRVGPGTPGGELLRRYWHPIATVPDLDAEPVLAITLLGENLALYRTDQGTLGLVAQRCPHRGASLAYGIPEADGLRCPYPVQEMGGLIWAYLGPEPAPLLPRYDLFVRDDLEREIGITRLPCNWLQIMENSLDPVHLEYLHGRLTNYVLKRQGKPESASVRHHAKIRFRVFEYGISKMRLLEGDSEDSDEWQVGHPILFPSILAVGDGRVPEFQIRVPVDDTRTYHLWYWTRPRPEGAGPQDPHTIKVAENPYVHANGRLVVETINGQDMMAWVTQGDISDRTTERLGTSDQGVILFRSILDEQIKKVQRGEDPMAVIRDPANNWPMIEIARERKAFYTIGNFVSSESGLVPTAQRGL